MNVGYKLNTARRIDAVLNSDLEINHAINKVLPFGLRVPSCGTNPVFSVCVACRTLCGKERSVLIFLSAWRWFLLVYTAFLTSYDIARCSDTYESGSPKKSYLWY